MRELAFTGYGIDVYRDGDRFWLAYDAGEIASKFVEIEVTSAEADKASRSEHDAYEVIIARQNTELNFR